MKRIKNFVLAVVMGLAIGVQCVTPVQAETYSMCAKCGGTIEMALKTRVSEEKVKCTEHRTVDCWIVTNYYQKICIYSCPKGCYYREDPIGNREAGESRHISIS